MNFIEIGSNDYDTILHSQFFSPKSWGIVIEPIKKYIDNLPKYSNVQYLDYALTAKQDGISTFYAPISNASPWWIKSVGSLDPTHKTLSQLNISDQRTKTLVKVMSLTTLYNLIPDPCIHFLKIDTEGKDFEILTGWDFNRYKPLNIQFESKLMDASQLKIVLKQLSAHGYAVVPGIKKDYNQVFYNHLAILEL